MSLQSQSSSFHTSNLNRPALNHRLGKIGRSVYSAFKNRLKSYSGETYPLHVGDTYLPPAVSLKHIPSDRALHRYTEVKAYPPFMQAICDYLSQLQSRAVSAEEILVTGGGTGGITALLQTLLSPNDAIMLLAPYWPLVAGAARLAGATLIEVPYFQTNKTIEQQIEILNAAWQDHVKVLYINTPNNPTGEVLTAQHLQALVDWARAKGIWIISDEVYDLYSYQSDHTYLFPLAPERVISVYSMSKAFGMAGYRCGFLQGDPAVLNEVERVTTHTLYSVPTASQWAGMQALQGVGQEWSRNASLMYQHIGQEVANLLKVDPVQGSTFLFIDVSTALQQPRYKDHGVQTLLADCVDQGLLIAPGSAFGPYPQHVRVCFTAVAPEITLRGVKILATLLGHA
jgi:aspartate/methionine/tyrosine aminotransferase